MKFVALFVAVEFIVVVRAHVAHRARAEGVHYHADDTDTDEEIVADVLKIQPGNDTDKHSKTTLDAFKDREKDICTKGDVFVVTAAHGLPVILLIVMITYYYKNIRSKNLSTLDEYKPGAWVCVENPSEDEIESLVKRFNLDAGHMEDVLDADEMPRLEREGDLTYIFVRYAYTNDDLELTTSPLLFVVGPDLMITVALNSLPRLQRFTNGKINFSTTQRTKLVLQILDQIVDQYEVFINNISRQIKIIRTRLRSHDVGNQDFIDFVLIEDELNEFLSAMLPTTAILRRLMLGRHIPLFEEDQELVEDLLLNNEQSIEGCRSNVKSIINIREAYSTIASNNLNRSMKILTAATVIIALPNVLYGMFGMNVDLPFQHEPWAYGAIVISTIVLTITIFVVGRMKRVF